MEKDPLSMSLDDLINENRQQAETAKGGGRGRAKGGDRGKGTRSDRGRKSAPQDVSITLNNRISKPRGARRGRPLQVALADI